MESREVRRFTDTALARATNTQRHTGQQSRQLPATRQPLEDGGGWIHGEVDGAERFLEATNFGQPPAQERPKTKRAEPAARHEVHGATYKTVMHEQTQSGDPLRFPPHGVPPQYAHPMNLRSLISEDAVRALPVSQEIEHGPSQSRTAEFASAAEEDYVMRQAGFLVHHHYATVGFRDRRSDGRRFRPTDNTEDMYGPQEPYNIESQTDHNTMDRLTMKKL